MPFGLRNAGATFVRAITSILLPLQQFSGSYVDDMAVGSFDWSAHVTHLRQFLATIRAAGLTLSLAKCEFARSEVRLLGHLVGSGVKRADLQHLSAIATIPKPTTKRELRRLLGALGYYREYIPHFALIAKPLTDLTNKRAPCVIEWRRSMRGHSSPFRRSYALRRRWYCQTLGGHTSCTLMLVVQRSPRP